MAINPVLFILLLIIMIIQVVIYKLLISKFKLIEDLINMINIEVKESKHLKDIKKIETTLDYGTINQENEKILFRKEIKLNKSSNVIDMDVDVKGGKDNIYN
ncbi:MAG: hypothetical protein GX214_02040 [Clostridiales bacterium]|nr:hypothetical protein [Clostridiales bacterium]